MPLKLREAAVRLGISSPTLKIWIYSGKLRTTTPDAHHRIPESELERFIPRSETKAGVQRRRNFHRIGGRNQPIGRVTEIKTDGLLCQVKHSISGQVITSIITGDAASGDEVKTRRRGCCINEIHGGDDCSPVNSFCWFYSGLSHQPRNSKLPPHQT